MKHAINTQQTCFRHHEILLLIEWLSWITRTLTLISVFCHRSTQHQPFFNAASIYLSLDSSTCLRCLLQGPQWWQSGPLTQTILAQITQRFATTLSGSRQTTRPPGCSTSTRKTATSSPPSPPFCLTERWAEVKKVDNPAHVQIVAHLSAMQWFGKGIGFFLDKCAKWAGTKARWVSLLFHF